MSLVTSTFCPPSSASETPDLSGHSLFASFSAGSACLHACTVSLLETDDQIAASAEGSPRPRPHYTVPSTSSVADAAELPTMLAVRDSGQGAVVCVLVFMPILLFSIARHGESFGIGYAAIAVLCNLML